MSSLEKQLARTRAYLDRKDAQKAQAARAAQAPQPGEPAPEPAPTAEETAVRGYLTHAARVIHGILVRVDEALQKIPQDVRVVAMAEPKPEEPQHGDPRKRPRAPANPVLTLMRMGLQAAASLYRVVTRLHPNLGKLKTSAA